MRITAIVLSRSDTVDKKIKESLKFADELIIWNSSVHDLNGDFAAHRNTALSNARGDWVLFVDDDEYVSKSLAGEIQTSIKKDSFEGFFIKRYDLIFHQIALHGEIGGIKIIRLAKKGSGKFVRPVHEYWDIKGKVGELKNPLYHLKDTFISSFISKMSEYGQIDIDELKKEGKLFSYLRLFINPIGKFLLNYIWRRGYLDGYVGLFSAYLMSIQSLTVRVFQWEKQTY